MRFPQAVHSVAMNKQGGGCGDCLKNFGDQFFCYGLTRWFKQGTCFYTSVRDTQTEGTCFYLSARNTN